MRSDHVNASRNATPWLLSAAAVTAVAATLAVTGGALRPADRVDPLVTVVDAATGAPIADAGIVVAGNHEVGVDGGVIPGSLTEPATVSVRADGYLPRTVAVAPGQTAEVALVASGDDGVSLRFGGDVALGRDYYAPADGSAPLLTPEAGVREHVDLLTGIQPLLADADLTVVTLDGPLVDDPLTAPADASGTATARALRAVGVDVVGLADGSVDDAGADGLESTLAALDAARLPSFGAGLTTEEAWRPALVEARGRTVAYLGCTTAEATGRTALATCGDGSRLADAVRSATTQADVVVVQLGDGAPAEVADAAARAGATVVVGGAAQPSGTLLAGGPAGSALGTLARVDVAGGLVHEAVDAVAGVDGMAVPAAFVGGPARD